MAVGEHSVMLTVHFNHKKQAMIDAEAMIDAVGSVTVSVCCWRLGIVAVLFVA